MRFLSAVGTTYTLNVPGAGMNSFPWTRLKKIHNAGRKASGSAYRIEADFNPLIWMLNRIAYVEPKSQRLVTASFNPVTSDSLSQRLDPQ